MATYSPPGGAAFPFTFGRWVQVRQMARNLREDEGSGVVVSVSCSVCSINPASSGILILANALRMRNYSHLYDEKVFDDLLFPTEMLVPFAA